MNNPSSKTIWYLVGISACLHALVFVVWQVDELSHSEVVTPAHSIKIHLLAKKTINAYSTKKKDKVSAKKVAESKSTVVQPSENTFIQKEKKSNKEIYSKENIKTSENKNTLNLLLHKAINSNKNYPLVALRLHHEGIVRVAFQLQNNGDVSSLEVEKSSGFNALDNAAILAVKRIQPFQPAKKHITTIEDFNIDIVFQL